jgi:hypothetical protein
MPYKSFGVRAADSAPKDNPRAFKKIARKRPVKKMTVDPKRPGRLTSSEKTIITTMVAETPGDISPAQVEGIAIALKRQPDAIADAIVAVREKLQSNLGRYVDIHMEAAQLALETDDPDVARKAAEFMIDKVSARRADGKVERLIEAPASEPNGPRIQIGIALGGVPATIATRTE